MAANEKADRAKQFMPFATLRGYYDIIRRCERVPEPRRELSEEESDELSRRLAQLRRGMMVTATWYRDDGYETMEGMVAGIDPVGRTITLVKTKIPIDDLAALSGEELA